MEASATDRAPAIETRGRFRLFAPSGADITPAGPRPRAFLAVLALAPGRRRPRDWMQRTLWSRSGPGPGGGSVRAILSNLRKLEPRGLYVDADLTDIWLHPAVRIDDGPPPPGAAVRLDGLRVPDPAFERWLAALRRAGPEIAYAIDPAPPGAGPAAATGEPLRVLIDPTGAGGDPRRLFIVSVLGDALARRISAHGLADAHVGPHPPWSLRDAPAGIVRVEFSAAGEARRPVLHLRAVAGDERRFLWSGRLAVTEEVEAFAGRAALAGFVSAAWTGILAGHGAGASAPPGLRLQSAAVRLFSGNHRAIAGAEDTLRALLRGAPDRSVPLAWLAFARLTRAYESAEVTDAGREEALALAREAATAAPTNPLVLALSASVERQLGADPDRARFLARAAVRIDEHNPYAIEALSDAELVSGAPADAYRTAIRARQAAQGMPNAFYWDMQVCLVALRLGDVATARRAAREVHAAQPGYRPALRYLAATALLSGDRTAAGAWAARLAEREPGFTLARLHEPDYPVATLRLAGLARDLRP